jgi:hypothetical protein
MSLNPDSPRQIARLHRIAARKAPFGEWLKWRFKVEVDAGIGSWLTDCHPVLGKGVFRYGRGALDIYEHGMVYGDGGTAIIFDDICDCEPITLGEIMQAKKNPWENIEVRFKTGAGDTILALPLFHYTSLTDVFQERTRRGRISANARPTPETDDPESNPTCV